MPQAFITSTLNAVRTSERTATARTPDQNCLCIYLLLHSIYAFLAELEPLPGHDVQRTVESWCWSHL